MIINDGDFTKTIYTLVNINNFNNKSDECIFPQIKESRFNEAIKVLHRISESSSTRAGMSLLAYCYYHIQDFTSAANYYEKLTENFPDNRDYKLYHAQVLYQGKNIFMK